MSYIDYKQKYLKYKTKYTNLTNSHTRIQRGGAEPKPPVEDKLPEGHEWNSSSDHEGKAIYDKYYKVLEKQIKTLNDQVDQLEADKKSAQQTSRKQEINAEQKAKKRKATRKEETLAAIITDRSTHGADWHEGDMAAKAQAGIARFVQDSSSAATAAREQKKQQKQARRAGRAAGRAGRTAEPKSQQRTPAGKGTGLAELEYEDAGNLLALDDEGDDAEREGGLVDESALDEALEDTDAKGEPGKTGVEQKATGKLKWAQEMQEQAKAHRALYAKRRPGLDQDPSPQTRRGSKSEAQLAELTASAAKAEQVAANLTTLKDGISDFEGYAFGNTNTLIEVLGGATTGERTDIPFDDKPGSVAHVIKTLPNVVRKKDDRDTNAKGTQLANVHGNNNKNIGWAIGNDNSNIVNLQKLFGRIADIIANIKTVKMYSQQPRMAAFKDVTQDSDAHYPLRLYEIDGDSKPTEDTPYGTDGDTLKHIIEAFAEYNAALLQKAGVIKAVQENGDDIE